MGDRVALYARISEDPLGLERGVTRQLEDGRALAGARGWQVVEEFVDNDKSALHGKGRPRYAALMAAVDAGEVDRIVTYMQSRLWRNRRERADAIERLRAQRVGVICVKGPELDLSSATGRMLAGLLGEFDTHESEVKGERVARAAEARALAGQANGAVLYGWRRTYSTDGRGRVLAFEDVEDPAEADVVREIVDRLLRGDGLRALAADLNARGVPAPRKGTWAHTTVRKIAMRPANVARRVYRGADVGPAAWPAIVGADKHEQVVALLSDPGRQAAAVEALAAKSTASRRYLLTYGIGRCGTCGGPLRAVTKRLKRRVARVRSEDNPEGVVITDHPLYVCEQGACVGRNRHRVDELVAAVVVERLSRPDALDLLQQPQGGSEDDGAEQARALRRRLDDAAEDYAEGLIDREQFRRVTAALRPKLEQAETAARRPVGPVPAALRELVGQEDVRERWEALSVAQRRSVLESLCDVVLLPTRRGAGFDPSAVRFDWSRS